MEIQSQPVVLVVEDERDLADLYTEGLAEEYEVRTAYDGEAALEQIDDDVAVVLLDRRMPGLSGDEVLEEIREQGYDCRVVMVTAVDADFDILDMEFDDYLSKPVTLQDVQETVDRMVSMVSEEDAVREFYGLVSKKYALETRLGVGELQDDEEYNALLEEVAELRERIDPDLAREAEAEASAVAFQSRDAGMESELDFDELSDEQPAEVVVDDGERSPTTEPVDESYETLRTGSPLFDALFDNVGDAVFVVDTDYAVIDANAAFEAQFGYDREEIAGEPLANLLGDPDQQGTLSGDDFPRLDQSSSYVAIEYRIREDEAIASEANVFRIRNSGGDTIAYGVTISGHTDDSDPGES